MLGRSLQFDALRTLRPDPLFPDLPALPQPAVFVAWKRECHRSTMTARAFGLDLLLISPFEGTALWRKALRYFFSTLLTIWILLVRRPRTLFVLNQPMPLALIARLYVIASGTKLVLDSHSKPLSDGTSKLSRTVYRWIARGARVNINHNREDAAVVRAMGAQSLLVPEIVGPLTFSADPAVRLELPAVLVVCSFARDEPVGLMLAAARTLPDITFYFTGDWRKSADMKGELPGNVVTLGFVARETYLTYLRNVSAVLTLSTRPNIMQMAAEEALCLGTPIVTNHSPILEEVFTRGAVFCALEAASLAAAVRRAVDENEALAIGMCDVAIERAARLRNCAAAMAGDGAVHAG